ncbi:DUF6355 family natural product biosynthesis protein [Streptomyces syringium]|uniref:DUF6355 family natural product biosynthesis protein n=1 Tax=Streptomyces syringium TaxID=76729 RepID=UPI003453ECC3
MRVRHMITGTLASAGLLLTSLGAVAVTATPATAEPCGYYDNGSDAYFTHCTEGTQWAVIKVRVAHAPDYERCMRPNNTTWLGSSEKIQGAHYVGKTC